MKAAGQPQCSTSAVLQQLAEALQVLSELDKSKRQSMIQELVGKHGEQCGAACRQALLLSAELDEPKPWFLDPGSSSKVGMVASAIPDSTVSMAVSPVDTVKDRPLREPCKHFLAGQCFFGVKCRFEHRRTEAMAVEAAPAQTNLQGHATKAYDQSPSAATPTQTNLQGHATKADHQRPSAHITTDTTPRSEITCPDNRVIGTGAMQESSNETNNIGLREHGRRDVKHGGPRLWIHIFLHKLHREFDLVPMLIGRDGSNVKAIYMRTDAKVRIRGRGSGHLEVTHKNGRQSEAF